MYNKSSSLSYCWTSPRYVRSIPPMLGDWEWYFSCRLFCLTRGQTWYSEVYLSPVCVVWRRNNNRKYMTRNPTSISMDRTFRFLGYLNQLEKYASVYSIAFQALWKEKRFMYPLPFQNLSLLDPPTPRKFRDPPWGGYGYFLEPHNMNKKKPQECYMENFNFISWLSSAKRCPCLIQCYNPGQK